MRIAGIEFDDIANGAGLGVAVFVQGCEHHCKGCQNPTTWDFNTGKEFTEEEFERIIDYFEQTPFATRLTITGGDPLHQSNLDGVFRLIHKFKQRVSDKNVWLYSGYSWNQLFDADLSLEQYLTRIQRQALVSLCDVFVDGEFEIEKRDVTLQFCGSSNQRVIDVQKSLDANTVVLWGED